MPRNLKNIKKKEPHRPQLPIDWKVVDDLLRAGCNGVRVAGYIGVHPDTLYLRTEIEKGMTFTAYSQGIRSKGEAAIELAQFQKAIGETKRGDTTLLMHLGKVRLGQKEATDVTISVETEKTFANLMDQIDKMQGTNEVEVR